MSRKAAGRGSGACCGRGLASTPGVPTLVPIPAGRATLTTSQVVAASRAIQRFAARSGCSRLSCPARSLASWRVMELMVGVLHCRPMLRIRPCHDDEREAILTIVNAAAEAYRGVIPADRWREPYMPAEELDAEIAAGVAFSGCEEDGELLGIMGIQPVRDVDLIRHAYTAPARQGRGVGGALLSALVAGRDGARPLLVGTWADAVWAIRFYERHGF